eukprot:CAMPEP_0177603344 /NCGR_PEP_ID=MMETSP0419_2-20121207/15458_1 /TAXON_ID=582737 /ORGANISM="Tetraselmis sp., Strain GSL018" /LENGTH=70 /DNA_ID=CAMNT_0019097101 /DNA_START=284 /DNA_END=493 /DNA_ORIENTATION=+
MPTGSHSQGSHPAMDLTHFSVTGPEKVSLNGYGTLVGVLVCLHLGALAVWLVLLAVSYVKKRRTGPAPVW